MAGIDLAGRISAVLLAGGLGSRIRELFPGIPKPLIPVADLPIIEWIVRSWARQGLRHFVVSTGYLGDSIERHFARNPGLPALNIECVREPIPMGTGGALASVSRRVCLNDAILVGNADSLCPIDIKSSFGEFEDKQADMAICTSFRSDTSQFGRVQVDSQGRITCFEEKVPGPGWVSAGVYLIRTRFISRFDSRIPLSIEREVFPALLAAARASSSFAHKFFIAHKSGCRYRIRQALTHRFRRCPGRVHKIGTPFHQLRSHPDLYQIQLPLLAAMPDVPQQFRIHPRQDAPAYAHPACHIFACFR
jgi:D-glycero-alpha-D-manno-heptose 1-phosphate guanylyltransferase